MNDQPWNEGAKLDRGENVDLEHSHCMWPYRLVPNSICAQFGEFSPDAFPEFRGEFDLVLVVLVFQV